MRGAIVGFGIIAMGHIAAYQNIPDITINAVVDPMPTCQQRARELDPSINTYGTIEQMFQSETLDFIDICSPPSSHNAYIRAALRHGCHVLCEKPLLLSSQEYRGILSHSSGKIIYPSHNYKFSPVIREMSKRLRSTTMGEPVRAHFRTIRAGHARGVSEWKPDWRRNPTIAGGGILYDHGPHSIYLASDMCGKFPTAVSCSIGRLNPSEDFTTEDTVFLTIDFDGITWAIDLIWASSMRKTYYSVITKTGAIIVENDKLVCVSSDNGYSEAIIPSNFDDSLHPDWFQAMFQDFIHATRNPERQPALLLEALTTSLVIEAAYKSAANNGAWTAVPLPSMELLLSPTS
jgi:predicted dehydrogenase